MNKEKAQQKIAEGLQTSSPTTLKKFGLTREVIKMNYMLQKDKLNRNPWAKTKAKSNHVWTRNKKRDTLKLYKMYEKMEMLNELGKRGRLNRSTTFTATREEENYVEELLEDQINQPNFSMKSFEDRVAELENALEDLDIDKAGIDMMHMIDKVSEGGKADRVLSAAHDEPLSHRQTKEALQARHARHAGYIRHPMEASSEDFDRLRAIAQTVQDQDQDQDPASQDAAAQDAAQIPVFYKQHTGTLAGQRNGQGFFDIDDFYINPQTS